MTLYDIASLMALCGLILYVVLGQTTVRKLRKNPETKDRLGIEFASGWDILNVAQALSLPRIVSKTISRGQFSSLSANSDILYKHTTMLDRWLARTVYWLLVASVLMLIFIFAGRS